MMKWWKLLSQQLQYLITNINIEDHQMTTAALQKHKTLPGRFYSPRFRLWSASSRDGIHFCFRTFSLSSSTSLNKEIDECCVFIVQQLQHDAAATSQTLQTEQRTFHNVRLLGVVASSLILSPSLAFSPPAVRLSVSGQRTDLKLLQQLQQLQGL